MKPLTSVCNKENTSKASIYRWFVEFKVGWINWWTTWSKTENCSTAENLTRVQSLITEHSQYTIQRTLGIGSRFKNCTWGTTDEKCMCLGITPFTGIPKTLNKLENIIRRIIFKIMTWWVVHTILWYSNATGILYLVWSDEDDPTPTTLKKQLLDEQGHSHCKLVLVH